MKRLRYTIDGDPWDPNVSPFGGEAAYLEDKTGQNFEECKDDVIRRYLDKGDLRALAATFSRGASPAPDILKLLARMLVPGDEDEDLPFRLEPKRQSRVGGAPENAENDWRDLRLAEMVEEKVISGLKVEDAAARVAKYVGLGEEDTRRPFLPGLGKDTARAAYLGRKRNPLWLRFHGK